MAFFLMARSDSSRLPGKVFLPLNGKMLVEVVIEQLKQIPQIPIVLLTSDRPVDDYLSDVAIDRGCEVYRGNIDDVAARISGAIKQTDVDAFFRINADSPCVDLSLIQEAIGLFEERELDFVSNLVNRTYPYGVAVEMIRSSCFLRAEPGFTGEQREHPTTYLYQNLADFDYAEICMSENNTEVRLTVDTLSDYMYFAQLLRRVPEFLNLETRDKIKLVETIND